MPPRGISKKKRRKNSKEKKFPKEFRMNFSWGNSKEISRKVLLELSARIDTAIFKANVERISKKNTCFQKKGRKRKKNTEGSFEGNQKQRAAELFKCFAEGLFEKKK